MSDATSGNAWKPRVRVLAGAGGLANPGALATDELPFCLSATVQKSNWFAADRFRLTFALYASPAYSYTFWGNQESMNVDVQVLFSGFGGSGWTSVFKGIVDKIAVDHKRGTVVASGRNKLAALIDNTFQASNHNPVLGETVTRLAESHGLTAVIDGEFAGIDYGWIYKPDEKNSLSVGIQANHISEHDLVAYLAQTYGAQYYGDGDTVYFVALGGGNQWNVVAPTPDMDGQGWAKHHPSNATALKFERNLLFPSYAHQVIGVRHDLFAKRTDVHKYPEDVELDADAPTKTHIQNVTGMTAEDADTKVKNDYYSYIGNEWTCEWTVAGPELLSMRIVDTLMVSGTDSTFDGPYVIDTIEHAIDWERGFKTEVHGKAGVATGLDGANG